MKNKLVNKLIILGSAYSNDNVPTFAAALAYYALFALAPLIILCTSIVGLGFGHEVAQEHIFKKLTLLLGTDAASQIREMITQASTPIKGITAQIISFIILMIAASGLFNQLQLGLNQIWGMNSNTKGVLGILKDRFLSVGLILIVGLLLLISLIFSTALTSFDDYINSFNVPLIMIWSINSLTSLLITSILFASIYRVLAECAFSKKALILGALVAAFLFEFGKSLLSLYLGHVHIENAFGPAGAMIIILVWIYYSAQILFVGAEIIKLTSDPSHPSKSKEV